MRSQSLFNFLTKAADVTQTPAGTRIHRGASATAVNSSTAAAGKQAVDSARKLKMADRGGAGASARAGARAGAGAQGGASQMPTTQAAKPNDAEQAATLRWGPFGGGQQGNGGGTQTNGAQANGTQANGAQANGAQAATSKPSPITFKGGYTVGGVNGNIDWAAKGDGSINVGGAQLTAEQYNAFNNVRSSLANQLRQQDGLSHTEARARATQMANQWMADQTAVANGGKALNKWQDPPAASATGPGQQTTGPAAGPATGQGQGQPAGPTTGPATGQGQGQPAEQGPRPIDTTSSWGEGAAEQPTGENPNTPPGGSGEGAGATQTGTTSATGEGAPTAEPANPSTVVGLDENASKKYLKMLRGNRKSTIDPKQYKAVKGYNGIYTKVGDRSGALYDRFGKQFTYQGKPVNDALLTTDEDWWLPGYGNNIRANISAHEDNRFRDNIFRPDELSAIGFTEEVDGHKGHWRNPSTGEIIDGNGKVYGGNTAISDVPIHRPNSARHGNYHGMAWWYDGSRHDVGVQR